MLTVALCIKKRLSPDVGPVFHALVLALGSSWSVSIACRFFIVPEHDSVPQ